MQYLDVYNVDLKYIRALSRADKNVMSQSPQIGKSSRPYIGIIVLLNGKKYCIPLTSTKNKKEDNREIRNNLDYIKIPHPTKKNEHGAAVIIGALNINNMIPVTDDVIRKYDLSRNPNDKKGVLQRKIICNKERSWCQIPENTELILKRANIVYDIVTNNQEKNRRLVRRCCDFTKLEAVLERYIKRLFKNPVYIAISDREKVGDILDKNGIVYDISPEQNEKGNYALKVNAEDSEKVDRLLAAPKKNMSIH